MRERYGVLELAIFGSYVRGEQIPVSDVDIVVRVRRPSRKSPLYGKAFKKTLSMSERNWTLFLQDMLGTLVTSIKKECQGK